MRVSSTWAAYLAQCPPFETVPLPLLWEKGSTARRWSAGTELEKELVRTDHDLASSSDLPICGYVLIFDFILSQEFLRSFFISTALPLLSARRCIAPPPTLPTFLHAYLLVSTRAFLVDAFHGLSLVPLADLFNHEQESTHNAHFASDQWVCSECGRFSSCSHDEDAGKAGSDDNEEDDDSCEMVSICPIAAGEEVFNHYGSQMSNAKLAVHYGFVLEANDHDLVSYSLLECVAACSAVPPASTTLDPPLASQLETLIAVPELLHGLSPDDPLVAWFPSSGGFDTSSTSFLSFDADARLSPALALLVAISALSSSSSIPELSHILDFMHALDRTAKSAVPLTPAHEEAFDRACLVVEKLVSSRIERQHEPALTASALLDMAQVNFSLRPPSLPLSLFRCDVLTPVFLFSRATSPRHASLSRFSLPNGCCWRVYENSGIAHRRTASPIYVYGRRDRVASERKGGGS